MKKKNKKTWPILCPSRRRRCVLAGQRRVFRRLNRAAAGPPGFPLPDGYERLRQYGERPGERSCFGNTSGRRGGGPGSFRRGPGIFSRRGRRSGGAVRGLRANIRPRKASVAREGKESTAAGEANRGHAVIYFQVYMPCVFLTPERAKFEGKGGGGVYPLLPLSGFCTRIHGTRSLRAGLCFYVCPFIFFSFWSFALGGFN